MKVNIFHFDQVIEDGHIAHIMTPRHLGYAEVETFDAEDIFDLCNWWHWAKEKPENLHADVASCGHGLLVINPETQEYWLALSVGWLVGDEAKIYDYVLKNRHNVLWTNGKKLEDELTDFEEE